MAKATVRISSSAAAWLRDEIAYLAEHSPAAADKVVDRLRLVRRTLADNPRMGQLGQIPDTRRVVIGSYILTTRARGAVVEIAAIRHARQRDAYAPSDLAEDDAPLISEGSSGTREP